MYRVRVLASLLILLLNNATTSMKLITVDNENGVDDKSCINSGTSYHPCKTLYQALKGIANDTAVHILNGTYPHNTTDTTLTFSNVSITGNGAGVTTVQCKNGSGFGFLNATNLYISGLTVLDCGQLRNSTTQNISSYSALLFRAALYYLNVEDVSIDDVLVSNSPGMGVAMYDVTGIVSVTNSNFTNNKVPDDDVSEFPGGGGFSVEFTYCEPGEVDPCDVSSNVGASYVFENCVFTFNKASTSKNIRYLNLAKGFGNQQFGRGGGLSVFFKGRAVSNEVMIIGSQFIGNNAKWGGGFHADFLDTSSYNNVTICDSYFTDNHCEFDTSTYAIGTGGGGVRVAMFHYGESDGHNHVIFSHCVFARNSAYFGGGLSFGTTKEHNVSKPTNVLRFLDCSWHGNIARTGSGVDLSALTLPTGVISTVYFSNCVFLMNSNNYVNQSILLLGIGSLYADTVAIDLDGNCSFEGNIGSAIAGTSSRISIFAGSRISFSNNTGHHGGAIALLGNAYLLIYNATRLSFIRNTALSKGGAIYSLSASERDFISTKKCFLYYYDTEIPPHDWNTSFIFESNEATNGKSIFCTTLLPCVWDGLPGRDKSKNVSDVIDVFKWNGTFRYDDTNTTGQISTEPLNVEKHNNDSDKFLHIPPGQRYNLQIAPVNDIDKRSSAIFFVRSSNTTLSVVDSTYTYTSLGTVQLLGEPDNTIDLELQTIGVRPLSVRFNVKLTDCPPGFYLEKDGNKSVCWCSSYKEDQSYRGVVKCDDNEGVLVAYLRSQYWAGYQTNNHKDLITGDCPENYCFINRSGLVHLPSVASKELLDKLLCEPKHRTGQLCGECMDGHYVYVNSPTYDCGNCDDSLSKHGVLFLLLLKYLPMALFLCLILFFNVSLVNGPLNAFILFSQIIFAMDIYASGAISKAGSGDWLADRLVRFYKFSYGIWNLDFFETLVDPFCTVKFKSALPVLVYQYASACFPLLLFVFFFNVLPWVFNWFAMSRINCIQTCALKLQRVCIRFRSRWSVENSAIHGFTTLLVLSYAKITSLTWLLLSYGVLYGPGGEESDVVVKVAWLDGTKPYLRGEHGKYSIAAFVFLFSFVLFAPIFLMLYPYLPKLISSLNWEEKWVVKKLSLFPLHHAVPFFDAIQGCFKDEYRFFAAFYFVYRAIAFAIYSFTITIALHYLWQIGFYTIILLIHCLFQPYKKRWHNCVDAFILSLLIAINAVSFYRYYQYTAALSDSVKSFWIQLLIIYLPLCYFLIYVAKRWFRWCRPRAAKVMFSKWRGRSGFQPINPDSQSEEVMDFPARLNLDSPEPAENVEMKDSSTWDTAAATDAAAADAASTVASTIKTYATF